MRKIIPTLGLSAYLALAGCVEEPPSSYVTLQVQPDEYGELTQIQISSPDATKVDPDVLTNRDLAQTLAKYLDQIISDNGDTLYVAENVRLERSSPMKRDVTALSNPGMYVSFTIPTNPFEKVRVTAGKNSVPFQGERSYRNSRATWKKSAELFSEYMRPDRDM